VRIIPEPDSSTDTVPANLRPTTEKVAFTTLNRNGDAIGQQEIVLDVCRCFAR